MVEVDEEYLVPREVEYTEDEDYIDYEEKQETSVQYVPVQKMVPQEIEERYIERKPFIAKLLTLGIVGDEERTRTRRIHVKETQVEKFEQRYMKSVPVRKTRTVTRTRLEYDRETRKKSVSQRVEVRLAPEDFYAEALQQLREEMRTSIRHA